MHRLRKVTGQEAQKRGASAW